MNKNLTLNVTVANLTAQGQLINARVIANANSATIANISGFNNITNTSYDHAMWFHLGQESESLTQSDQELYDYFLAALPLIDSLWDPQVHIAIYMAIWYQPVYLPGIIINYPLALQYSTYWDFKGCTTVPPNEFNYTCRPWWIQMTTDSINLEYF